MARPRVWSIFDKESRLVLALSDQPGEFNFARYPDDGVDPVKIPFATLQCYDKHSESEILNLVFRAKGLEDFLQRLSRAGYKVHKGRPHPAKIARL